MSCPLPNTVSPCRPIQVYSAGGTEYAAFQWCDLANSTPVLAVFELCSGIPSGPATTYTLTGAPYTPVGAIGPCKESVDYEILCDKGTDPVVQIISLWDASTTPPTLKYYTAAPDGTLTDYTPVGPISSCAGTDIEDTTYCYIATVAGTGYAQGDQLLQVTFWNTSTTPPTLVNTVWRNQTQNTLLTTAPTIADLIPCDVSALPPQQFCFKSSTTAPTDFPGRSFSGVLSIARGFTVSSVIVGVTTYALGITWGVLDEAATVFMPALAAAIQAKIPGSTVTVTATTTIDECLVTQQDFTINVACIKQSVAPVNIDLVYDAGSDLIQNAGFEENPPNDTFHQAKRQDAGGNIRCTNVANRGWETNDPQGEFEHWPAGFLGVTATPRGTGIQEVNANGANTIWQTIVVPVAATYTLRATVGGRGVTEQFPIKLSTGDTNAAGAGDLINAVITAPSVTGGTGAPWTSFSRNIFLAAGTYTLSLRGPGTASVGGLFTDPRLFTSNPGQIKSLTPDDTCVVTENVTTDTTDCQLWQPQTGQDSKIISWVNVETGVTMSNTAFWAQVPSPECCTSSNPDESKAVTSNLIEWYPVCGMVGGESMPLIRQLILDQSGGTISEQFVSADGASVTPTSWTPGGCLNGSIEIQCACSDDDGDGVYETSYRKIVSISSSGIVTELATYNQSLTEQYTPLNPGPCDVPGDNLIATAPNYKVISGAATWSLAADAVAPVTSVTVMVVAVGNTVNPPTVTSDAGVHPLFAGQSVSWSVIHHRDVAGLRAPLAFTSNTGDTLAIAWTTEEA